MIEALVVTFYTMCWFLVFVLTGFLGFQFIKEFIKVIRGRYESNE